MTCYHKRIIEGLDGFYCPDCKNRWKQLPLIPSNPDGCVACGSSLDGVQLPPAPGAPSKESSVSIPQASASSQISQGIYEYLSHGSKYFRYVANRGHTILESRHIPGGQVINPTAQARALEVRRWISQGRSPGEIIGLINSWRAGKR